MIRSSSCRGTKTTVRRSTRFRRSSSDRWSAREDTTSASRTTTSCGPSKTSIISRISAEREESSRSATVGADVAQGLIEARQDRVSMKLEEARRVAGVPPILGEAQLVAVRRGESRDAVVVVVVGIGDRVRLVPEAMLDRELGEPQLVDDLGVGELTQIFRMVCGQALNRYQAAALHLAQLLPRIVALARRLADVVREDERSIRKGCAVFEVRPQRVERDDVETARGDRGELTAKRRQGRVEPDFFFVRDDVVPDQDGDVRRVSARRDGRERRLRACDPRKQEHDYHAGLKRALKDH